MRLNGTLTFFIAETEEVRRRIYYSRLHNWGEEGSNLTYMLKQDWSGDSGKDGFDDNSILACLIEKNNNQVVASCRATPCLHGKYEITDSLPEEVHISLPSHSTIQINRLIVNKEYRNKEIYLDLFAGISDWILDKAPYSNYFAVCSATSVRLYEKIGANNLLGDGFFLKGRGSNEYFIVHGNIYDFNKKAHSIIKNKSCYHANSRDKNHQPTGVLK